MSIEAMKLALAALNEAVVFREGGRQKAIDAIDALRTAIQQAEAQQVENSTATTEPVATVKTINGVTIGYLEKHLPNETPLYTHPVPDDVVRDAERYRWLRKTRFIWGDFRYISGVHPTVVGLEFQWFPTQAQEPTREDLDAAIDAAMLAAKVGGKQ